MNNWGINDITISIPNSGGGNKNITITENTETEAGYSFNGKPVYRKFLNVASTRITASQSATIATDIQNLLSANVFIKEPSGNTPQAFLLPYVFGNGGFNIIVKSGNALIQGNGSAAGNYLILGMIEYTKTS